MPHQLPEWVNANARRRVIRAPVNPMDKSTIVSILPKPIKEVKHTIQPGVFEIDSGTFEKPALLVVGTSSWWREIDDDQPLLEIPVSSVQIADSFVKDYCNGLIGCNMGDTMPGLFYVPGAWDIKKINTDYISLLVHAQSIQRRWFSELVKQADSLWSRTNGNPLAIDDTMRLSAEHLQLNNKPWMRDFQTMELKNCPACGHMRNSNFPICANCHVVIDAKTFAELNLSFAKG